ncbi:MAG: glycosyltransferase family 4 protein [Candidatus Hydrogenedentes bacterium]|nr:glycosyltransferase family 4 protein [Candidatus Hydrogenedentota bacterium]
MKVLKITAGTGGTFYCQNCLRDGVLVRALRRRGCDVLVVPLYLPILIDAEGMAPKTPVFFGGVNVYLQQQLGLFRKTPRWIDRLFDSPWVLRQAAAREGSTSAAELGPMTYSMLQGREGRQRKELERLLEWLIEQEKPDIVHMSNALLLGVAKEVKSALKVPIVCSLQDEDTWLDAMTPNWRDYCWEILAERAREVDAFVAVSKWYADRMISRLKIPAERVSVIPLGVELEETEPSPVERGPLAIGYLSRICGSLGFDQLVDAFIRLKRVPGLYDLRLRATGGVTSGDQRFLQTIKRRLADAACEDSVDIVPDFTKTSRKDFLRTVSVLSVPAPQGEAFGLFVLEAGGCGVPVVQPDTGAFREVVEMTGGGLVYDPKDPDGLFENLKKLLLDPELAKSLGEMARSTVRAQYTGDAMAEKMDAVYKALETR